MSVDFRNVLVSAVILVVALSAAWCEWTDDDLSTSDGVVAVEGQVEALEDIVWKTDKEEITIERVTDVLGSYWWVTHKSTRMVPVPKKVEAVEAPEPPVDDPEAEDGTDSAANSDDESPETEVSEDIESEELDGVAEDEASSDLEDVETPERELAPEPPTEPEKPEKPEMVEEVTIKVYKADTKDGAIESSLGPLVALRQLDSSEATFESLCQKDQEKEITKKGSLTLTYSGQPQVLDIWCQAYGTRDWYVQKVNGGEVYLVDDELLRPFNQARSRLPDRNLWSLADDEIVAAAITVPGAESVNAVQKDHDLSDDRARWVKESDQASPDKDLHDWMTKMLALNGSSYLGPEEVLTDPQERFRVTFLTEDGRKQTVVVVKDGDAWWARSEHTRTPLDSELVPRGYLKLIGTKVEPLVTQVSNLN